MPALEGGRQFERYHITRYLRNSVSGESYEAADPLLQRKVTLKLIHPWSTLSDAARRQFFREMQGISMLNHPYLAPILDYGEIDGRLYVVRRYFSNGSLLNNEGRLWFKPPFPVEDALQYGHQLAQALDYIHQHGYLHGALTFSNVLLARGPNINHERDYAPFLLSDVGLTNFVRRFGQPINRLFPITTAPEQLSKRMSQASDQFALAVLLYYWLAGRPPYPGSAEEIEQAKLTGTFPTLSSLNPHVSFQQAKVIHRALSIYPEERYPSVLAFSDALLTTRVSLPPSETFFPDPMWQPASPFFAVEGISDGVDIPSYQKAEVLETTIQPAQQATTARLIVRSLGGAEPREYLLEDEDILLGRAGSDDVLLEQDASISRHHALLKYVEDHYVLLDQRSATGIYVNGEQLPTDEGRVLVDSDCIRIGNYELIFRLNGAKISPTSESST